MNTSPTIKATKNGSGIDVATARYLLQHALEKEEQDESDEDPELARQRAFNAHTGASVFLPLKDIPEEEPDSVPRSA